jgi:hypothetical protein
MNARLYGVIIQVSDIEAAVDFFGQLFEQPGEPVRPGRTRSVTCIQGSSL